MKFTALATVAVVSARHHHHHHNAELISSVEDLATESDSALVANLSSTLAGSDSGFMSADTTLVGVNAISAGLTAGFAPRDNDAAGGPLFDAMDQVNAYSFVCSFLFFCLLILPSPRLL